jgi:hypothetical protein
MTTEHFEQFFKAAFGRSGDWKFTPFEYQRWPVWAVPS